MERKLKFNPSVPIIATQPPHQAATLVSLDGRAEAGNEELSIQLRVSFHPIAVKRGLLQSVDYYIGSTAADVEVSVASGEVIDVAEFEPLLVNQENTSETTVGRAAKLAPTFKGKTAGAEIEVTPGEVAMTRENKRASTATFAHTESHIPAFATNGGRGARWMISMPRGTKAMRDFIADTYCLESRWRPKAATGGSVHVRNNVEFFDDERRPLGAVKSFLMAYVLWKNRISTAHLGESRNTFEVYP